MLNTYIYNNHSMYSNSKLLQVQRSNTTSFPHMVSWQSNKLRLARISCLCYEGMQLKQSVQYAAFGLV